jgi:hypothetical protein
MIDMLFKYENEQKSIIGSMRCIFDKTTKYENDIETIAKTNRISEMIDGVPDHCFPSMNFNAQIKNAIVKFKTSLAIDKNELIEVGRFMISKEERNKRLAFIFMEMLYAYFPKKSYFYNYCRVSHTAGYRIAGGELFPETSPFEMHDVDWNVLYFNREKAASFISERTNLLSDAFSKFGHIVWDAEKPNAFFVKNKNNECSQIL